MKVAVVDYGVGNLSAVCGVLKAAAALAQLDNVEINATKDPSFVASCDKLVLPGIGSYLSCYNKLNLIPGMVSAIGHAVSVRGVEFLGICVGMQLLASVGFEGDRTLGFGWLPGIVTRLDNTAAGLPHVGWDSLTLLRRHYMLTSLPLDACACAAYFVHSYEYLPLDYSSVLATCSKNIVAAVCYRNVVGVQFHPEKSHWVGIHFCRNFLSWRASVHV
ncbi:Imidazole glycerol phosphate synthase subunit HisH 1 [Candidatus Hodgkinia cicadicola]|nr:Imidazole glycerol phosphate synthase subunit HisH 1 [Candidatus Hodgkinia cicadicola]